MVFQAVYRSGRVTLIVIATLYIFQRAIIASNVSNEFSWLKATLVLMPLIVGLTLLVLDITKTLSIAKRK